MSIDSTCVALSRFEGDGSPPKLVAMDTRCYICQNVRGSWRDRDGGVGEVDGCVRCMRCASETGRLLNG